jgi:hypothetical protein
MAIPDMLRLAFSESQVAVELGGERSASHSSHIMAKVL